MKVQMPTPHLEKEICLGAVLVATHLRKHTYLISLPQGRCFWW